MVLKVIGLEEARPVYEERSKELDYIVDLKPGRVRHSVTLELPDGSTTKVQVSASVYEKVSKSLAETGI